jgi:hypothetical protein
MSDDPYRRDRETVDAIIRNRQRKRGIHYNGQSDPALQDVAAQLRQQFQNSKAGFDDKVDGFVFEGRYYARNTEGAFVDTSSGTTFDLRKLLKVPDSDSPLLCQPLGRLPMAEIPPRPWAYGSFLMFGQAAVIGAVDGGGKGAQAVAIALSMISGRALLGEKVWRTGPVAIISYEDDPIEWRRRIAVACLQYGVDYDQACDSFHFISRPDDRIKLAAQSAIGRDTLVFPDGEAIIAELKRIGAVLLIVDPFNHAHTLEDGNSNVLVAQLASEIARIARESHAAALVLHHLRKGSVGSADDLMGAVMLRATFRAARVLVRMTAEEAEALGIEADDVYRYSRVAGTKENYAPPPERATWYKFESHDLGNGAGIYPDGDNVHAVTRWTPPDVFAGLPKPTIAEIFDELRAGPGEGEYYSPYQSAKDRWAGWPVMRIAEKSHSEAKLIVKGWCKSTTLTETGYYSHRARKTVLRVVLNETKAREILGSLYRPPNDLLPPADDRSSPAPVADNPAGSDRHDLTDRIYAAIDRGLPPNGNGVGRCYSADAAAEHAAWRVVKAHRPELNSNECQALVKRWVKDGILLPGDSGGVQLSPLVKKVRGIGECPG